MKATGFLPGGRQEVRGWAGRRSLIRRRRGELIERRHRRWLGSWLTTTRCLHQTWREVEWVWEGRWGSTCSPTLAMVTALPLHPHRCQRRSGISFPPAAHLWAVYERWTGVGAGSWLAWIGFIFVVFFVLFFFYVFASMARLAPPVLTMCLALFLRISSFLLLLFFFSF